MSLEGKTAVITGASRGIGAAIARMLHDRGCNLGLASRSGDDLGLERVVARPCDVRDLDALVGLCDATAGRFGGIDIVVPNAGVGAYGPFLDLSREFLDEMLDAESKAERHRGPGERGQEKGERQPDGADHNQPRAAEPPAERAYHGHRGDRAHRQPEQCQPQGRRCRADRRLHGRDAYRPAREDEAVHGEDRGDGGAYAACLVACGDREGYFV